MRTPQQLLRASIATVVEEAEGVRVRASPPRKSDPKRSPTADQFRSGLKASVGAFMCRAGFSVATLLATLSGVLQELNSILRQLIVHPDFSQGAVHADSEASMPLLETCSDAVPRVPPPDNCDAFRPHCCIPIFVSAVTAVSTYKPVTSTVGRSCTVEFINDPGAGRHIASERSLPQ